MDRWLQAIRPWVMAGLAVPALTLWALALADRLGANPAEALIRGLGLWALRLLWLTLLVTPLRHWTGWAALATWRRPLGLWAFAYALLHLAAYAWLDQGLSLAAVWHDAAQRPFILVGLLTLLMLLPLALTSSQAAVRRLGWRCWKRLHRLVYLAAVLALLHWAWMRSGKRLYGEVVVYGALLAGLLGWRLLQAFRSTQAHAPAATDRPPFRGHG